MNFNKPKAIDKKINKAVHGLVTMVTELEVAREEIDNATAKDKDLIVDIQERIKSQEDASDRAGRVSKKLQDILEGVGGD